MSASASARRAIAAFPTLMRVGFAEALAYRAEFVVWLLTLTMPLVSLALWSSVAAERPVGRFGPLEFQAYFLVTLVVRQSTGSWLVWELNEKIRLGTLSQRLLKPVHPLVVYAANAAAAVPLRLAVCAPVVLAIALGPSGASVTRDPGQLALFAASLAAAWAINFFIMAAVGSLAFFIESATSVYGAYLSVFTVLSGYLVPLELLPGWARAIAHALPLRQTISLPVELALGLVQRPDAAREVAVAFGWAAALGVAAALAFRSGVRRFAAFGG